MELPASHSRVVSFVIIHSSKMRPSVLVVPVDSANSRQYGMRKSSADNSLLYFSCRRCEYLNRTEPVDGEFYAVSVHMTNGFLKYPYGEEHHPSCTPIPNDQLKALVISRKYKQMVCAGHEEPFDAYEKVR